MIISKVEFSNTEVGGWRHAVTSMRNPLNSWDRLDSNFNNVIPELGPKDLELAKKLISAGKEHRKFLRTIIIWTDIKAPRYVWTELDTYKVGTVRNSCSTMHKLGSVPLTLEDFSCGEVLPSVLEDLNTLGQQYRNDKLLRQVDNELLRKMKQRLPEGYLQKAGFCTNYEVALNMFFQRSCHRLPEWRYTISATDINDKYTYVDGDISICDWISSLPYMDQFISCVKNK